jgi:membrane-bound serine protease (ClpP class)
MKLRISHIPAVLIALAVALVASMSGIEPPNAHAARTTPNVLVAPITGAIDPVSRDFVESVLRRAARDKVDAVVFELDTPGGLMSSMDDIKKEFLKQRDFPIIVYVAPSGARAASAGVFITMASDVAAMAPGTTIGSATPVQGGGQDISGDMRKKVINDAVSSLESLAREHGRDVKFAREAIVKAANIDAREAKRRGVIEFVAPSLDSLLTQADGYTTKPKQLTLRTKDATITRVDLSWTQRVLKLIIDPNIIFLLFSAGLLGLGFEITNPGSIFPGVAGAICLVTALYGLQVLPTTTAGVVLLLLAATFLLAEIFVTSGVLGAGGALCLFLGGLLLFERGSGFEINLGLLLVTCLTIAACFVYAVRKIMDARKAPVQSGTESLIGSRGTVRRALTPNGTVYAQGELWKAVTTDGSDIGVDAEVEIVRMEGLLLEVAPVPVNSPHDPGSESASPG